MNRNVSFTDEEIQVLIGLIDLAIKSHGLQVAGNALVVATKLQNVLNAPQELKAVEAA